jgi:intracellular septation protein
MKFLFDLFPVLLFFGFYKWADGHADTARDVVNHYLSSVISTGTVTATQAPVILATAVAIVAAVAQILYLLVRRKKIDGMLWLSVSVIIIFGGLTIYFNNDTFIKWKPTILYWCFATALTLSQVVMKKNAIRTMMEAQIKLPDAVWQRLNLAWIGFFAFMGLLNLLVAFVIFRDNTSAWVNFKAFGGPGLTFAFAIGQSFFLAKYVEEQK